MAEIARRRLELLSAELTGIRDTLSAEPTAGDAEVPEAPVAEPDVRTRDAVPAGVVEGLPHGQGQVADPPTAQLPRGRHARRPVTRAGRVGGWVHDRLPPTLQGHALLSASHLSVVALLVAAAFAVTAWWVVRADGAATVAPAAGWSEPTGGVEAAPAQLVTPAADPTATATTGEPAVVVVDVAGKVRRPGIATLPIGSRVVDALEAAGGVRHGVDLTTLNLARLLVDGEQIVVGVPPPGGVAAPAASAAGGVAGGAADGAPLVNINSATQVQLEELPGVGPVTAQAILQWRTDNGPFTAVDELLEVSGIGDATLAEIAPFVTL
jgi:competence protein ComEA